MRPKVLVTAIGTAASTAIVAQLKRTNKYYIVGADINQKDQVATSLDVDEFYTFPLATQNLREYIDFVIEFCKEHNIKYYFATIDEEVVNLSKNREKFEMIGVSLCIPNNELIMTCHYKNVFSDWIETNFSDLAIKRFAKPEDIKDTDFPVFMKPVEGRASLGCQQIKNRSAIDELIKTGISFSDYIIQEFIEGEIITVDLIRNRKYRHAQQVQRIEELRNPSGCGIAVKIISDPQLTEICNQLMEKLDLNGVVNAEFFRENGKYKIVEINPRFSAGTSFSCAIGCDTVIAALNIAREDDFILGKPSIEIHLAKRYETYLMN